MTNFLFDTAFNRSKPVFLLACIWLCHLELHAQDSLDMSLDFDIEIWNNAEIKLDKSNFENKERLAYPHNEMRYSSEDNSKWRFPEINDFQLPVINTALNNTDLAFIEWNGVGWFRLEINVDESITNKKLALIPEYHFGASEIYLNGEFVGGFGRIGASAEESEYIQKGRPLLIFFTRPGRHILSIRYANYEAQELAEEGITPGFRFRFGDFSTHLDKWFDAKKQLGNSNLFILGALIAVTLVHLLLFIFYPLQKNNFYFALFTGSLALLSLSKYMLQYTNDPYLFLLWFKATDITLILAMLMALRFSYELFYAKKPIIYHIIFLLAVIMSVYYWAIPYPQTTPLDIFVVIVVAELLRGLVRARFKKKEGYWIIGTGLIGFMMGLLVTVANNFMDLQNISNVAQSSGTALLIASFSIFLSRNVAGTNKRLRSNIHEIRQLGRQKLEQEMLTRQKEIQRKLLASENSRKSEELNQARTLQLSMLPKSVPEHPELEIAAHMDTAYEVGGDYYDFSYDKDEILTGIIGDATGHGMRSGIVVATAKSHFVSQSTEPNLCELMTKISTGIRNMGIKTTFMCMLSFRFVNKHNGLFEYCSAGMPPLILYRCSTQQVEVILTKSMPLGSPREYQRERKELHLEPGDTILMLTDGLIELFNAEKEMLGIDRIAAHFSKQAEQSPEHVVNSIRALARNWSGNKKAHDDITMLCLKRVAK